MTRENARVMAVTGGSGAAARLLATDTRGLQSTAEERPGPVDVWVNAAYEAFRAPPQPAERLDSAERSPRATAPAGTVGAFGRR